MCLAGNQEITGFDTLIWHHSFVEVNHEIFSTFCCFKMGSYWKKNVHQVLADH